VALVFNRVLVVCEGRNIGAIVRNIEWGNKVIIEEYDPNSKKLVPKCGEVAPVTVVVESMEFSYENVENILQGLRKPPSANDSGEKSPTAN
jgi:hypothetical protein